MPKILPGKRPSDLGVNNGKLKAAPKSPNCASSQTTSKKHAVAPIAIQSTGAETLASIKAALLALPNTSIVTEDGDYLHAECASTLMGFVDDVEFWHNTEANQIEVRSASRVGYSDWGVNKKRVEAIRSAIA